jgi:hypothetical protein
VPVRQRYAGVDFIPQTGIYEFGIQGSSASSLTLTTLNPKYNEMERRKLQVYRRVIRELRAITR